MTYFTVMHLKMTSNVSRNNVSVSAWQILFTLKILLFCVFTCVFYIFKLGELFKYIDIFKFTFKLSLKAQVD